MPRQMQPVAYASMETAWAYSHTSPEPDTLDLTGLLNERLHGLASILKSLFDAVDERQGLSGRVLAGIQVQFCEVSTELRRFDETPRSPDVESKRLALARELAELKREERQEAVRCWESVERLRSEARKWQKEHQELALRARILGET